MGKILVIDDEAGIRELLSEILIDEGHDVYLAKDALIGDATRRKIRPDLILLDIWMPDQDGISLLKDWYLNGLLSQPVVMMSGHGTIETAVEATKIGAAGFLEKPFTVQKLISIVDRLLLKKFRYKKKIPLLEIGNSKSINILREKLENLKNVNCPVLFESKFGSDDEEYIRFFHIEGTPYFCIDLKRENNIKTKNLPDTGLLILKNINYLDYENQMVLLNYIDNKKNKTTRIISVINNFNNLMKNIKFDERLYRILSEVIVSIPTLEERKEDIPKLANTILNKFIEDEEMETKNFTTGALNYLRNRKWPGNFIQLESAVKSCARFVKDGELNEKSVAEIIDSNERLGELEGNLNLYDMSYKSARSTFEKIFLDYHIKREKGNLSQVAKKIGIERTHLYRKIKQLKITNQKKIK